MLAFPKRLLVVLLAVCLLSAFSTRTVSAASPSNVAMVQEVWTVVLNTPDPQRCAPQFVTRLLLPNNAGKFVLNWNFRNTPSFSAGGIELQAWPTGAAQPSAEVYVPQSTLSQPNDTIQWTQVLKIQGSDCNLKITACSAQSWGSNINSTAVSLANAGLTDLNNYSPQASVDNSSVQFGGNRIQWFGITEIRYYDANGKLLATDTTPKVVYQQGGP